MIKIATYGSLREGEYNFERFKEVFGDGIVRTNTTEIEGYELYSLGGYPAAVKSEGKLTVDTLEVSEAVHERIKAMELGAGYVEETIEINNEPHLIYLFEQEPRMHAGIVSEGDWIQHINR